MSKIAEKNALKTKEEVQLRIMAETAKIPWKELLRFFAQGIVVMVKPRLDLVEVAFEITMDNQVQVKSWMDSADLTSVSDDQAREWLEANVLMWAVVVKPWVLVQPVIREN